MKKLKEKLKYDKKGITLIALVITIIVLLILAGVSIATLTKENGILIKATDAKKISKEKEIREQVQLEVGGSYGNTGKIDLKKLNDNLKKNIKDLTYKGEELSESNKIRVLPAVVKIGESNILIEKDGNVLLVDEIPETALTDIYVYLYTDGTLTFGSIDKMLEGKTISKSYGNVQNKDSNSEVPEEIISTPWLEDNESIKNVIVIDEIVPISTQSWFKGCINLNSVDLEKLNTSKTIDMSYMFLACENIRELDLGNFDTSNVTNMRGMFYGCANLLKLNLSSFDTKNVTTMAWMFGSGDDINYPNIMNLEEIQGIEEFDTRNVKDMQRMFRHCHNLKKLDLHKWDVSNVESMLQLFNYCTGLEYLDISGWNMRNVTTIQYMFNACQKINTTVTFNFNAEKLTSFLGCFNAAAKEENSNIKVNYTNTAESIIDQVIATGKGNIVKGEKV